MQAIIPLGSGNGALRLTTARYFTPSGRSIQGHFAGYRGPAGGAGGDPGAVLDRDQGRIGVARHLKAEGDEQGGSQSYVPPEAKDDKALNMALELIRGTKINTAFPPNPKSATLPN